MKRFIIEINDAEEKALLTDMFSIQECLENSIHEKARRLIDRIVEQVTNKQAKKLSVAEKHQIIRETVLETGAEKNARLEVVMRM